MSPKLKILIKNVLLYRKRTKKVHLNIYASVDKNPQRAMFKKIIKNQDVLLALFAWT
jgi:hypothetical protein